jgi:ABC-2 type transport system permease protein
VLARIVRHDWRHLAAERTVPWLAVAVVALVGYGVWNGATWTSRQEGEARASRAAYDKRIAELRTELRKPPVDNPDAFAPDPRAPRTLGFVRQDAFLPPGPLGALAVGQADLLPAKVSVTVATGRRLLTRNYEVQNPLNLLAGRFDLAFAVVYLLPLLILALSYDLVSGERDQGTLGLLLSQPMALSAFVRSKVVSRFLLVLGLGGGVSLVGVLLAGLDFGRADTWARLGLWLLAVVVYSAFWFGLAVLVSAVGRSSATNAVLLASAWLGLVVVLPSLLGLAVAARYPVPSRALLVHAMREAANDADRRSAELLEKYFQDHPELTAGGKPDLGDFYTRYLTAEQDIERRVAPVLDRYDSALLAQQRMVSSLRFLSPAVAMQEALNDIAGTGLARHRRFLGQAWSFAEATKAFFLPRIFRRETLTEADYDALPQFRFVEEQPGDVLRRVVPGIGWIFLATVAVGWVGLASLRGYPIAA